MTVEWKDVDADEFVSYVQPNDGGEPFCYWWKDMRPGEVRDSIIEAYERGFAFGIKSCQQENERLRAMLDQTIEFVEDNGGCPPNLPFPCINFPLKDGVCNDCWQKWKEAEGR